MRAWGCWMVVAMVGVLAPAGVDAARKPKRVIVADPTSGAGAAVDESGNLKVTIPGGIGGATVDGDGNLKVVLPGALGGAELDADGNLSVRAVPVAPERPVNTSNDLIVQASGNTQLLFSGFGVDRLSISSIVFAAEGPNPGSVRMFVSVYVSSTPGDSCNDIPGGNFGAGERLVAIVPIGQTVNLTYPTPLVVPSGATDADDVWCVQASSSGSPPAGYMVHVSANGFLNY